VNKVEQLNPRLVRFIQNTVIIIFTVLLGILFALIYLKARLFLPASQHLFKNYMIAAFIPVLLVECILLLLLFTRIRDWVSKNYRLSILKKYFVFPFILIFYIIGISYFPNPDLAFILLISGIVLIVSFWSVLTGNLKPLLISWFPISFLLVLIIFNMIPPQGNWGRITHLYGFRSKEPVMGEGGRLVPDLKVHLKGLDSPTPRSFITNSHGFRNNQEFNVSKKQEEYRILNLGDSFSIGYHLDQSLFLGPLLENRLRSDTNIHNINVLNAAISDPAYGLYYFQHYGLDFNPDIVILGLSGNDFVQSYSFSGPGQRLHLVNNTLEINPDYRKFVNPVNKFKEYVYTTEKPSYMDGNNSDKKLSKYLPVYSLIGFQNLSIIRKLKLLLDIQIIDSPRHYEILKYENQVRMIDGFPNIGFYYKKDIKPVIEMYETTYNLFKTFKQTCDKHGIQFILLYFPSPFEVIPSEWKRLCSNWRLNPNDFDLSKHRRTVSKFANEHDILFVDTTDELIKSGKKEDLFLPLDSHFTELAHKIIAGQLALEILNIMK